MCSATFLLECLHRAGIRDVVTVEPATGGLAALAGIATRRDAPSVFVKAFADAPADDVFVAEAEGLAALRELGGVATPEVILANRELLVLSVLRPRPRSETFWEQFAHALARLHMSTTHPRFGWHRDNWLGRCRQINTWDDDGFAFFAQHRLLRWLGQPRVEAALDPGRPGGAGAVVSPAARTAAGPAGMPDAWRPVGTERPGHPGRAARADRPGCVVHVGRGRPRPCVVHFPPARGATVLRGLCRADLT